MAAESTRRIEPGSGAGLVARIRAGDRAAEAELVEHFLRGVTAILRCNTTERSLVEDLRQETFRIALEKIRAGEVREPERLAGFMCALARNLATGHFRKSSRGPTPDSIEIAREVADPGPGPAQQLLRKENARIVRKVLDELRPARYRQILHRYYVEEETKEEICAALGMSSLRFNRVMHRARERYRELFRVAVEGRVG